MSYRVQSRSNLLTIDSKKERFFMIVYVLNKDGQPLMPTKNCTKVRHFLEDNKAKVVKRCPFTIKLLYDTTNYTQDLILSSDTGSCEAGFAVSTIDADKNGSKHIVYKLEIV